MPETVKLFGSLITDKTRNGENVITLEVVGIILVKCNLVDNQYQQNLEVLYTFAPYRFYTYLLIVNLVFLKTYNTKFNKIVITTTDENVRPLVIKNKVNLTLVIK